MRAHEVIDLGKNGGAFGFYHFDLQCKKVGKIRKDNNLALFLPEKKVCKGRSFSVITTPPTSTHLPFQIPSFRHLFHIKDETLKVFISTFLIYTENISSHLKNFLSDQHYGSSNSNNRY